MSTVKYKLFHLSMTILCMISFYQVEVELSFSAPQVNTPYINLRLPKNYDKLNLTQISGRTSDFHQNWYKRNETENRIILIIKLLLVLNVKSYTQNTTVSKIQYRKCKYMQWRSLAKSCRRWSKNRQEEASSSFSRLNLVIMINKFHYNIWIMQQDHVIYARKRRNVYMGRNVRQTQPINMLQRRKHANALKDTLKADTIVQVSNN